MSGKGAKCFVVKIMDYFGWMKVFLGGVCIMGFKAKSMDWSQWYSAFWVSFKGIKTI